MYEGAICIGTTEICGITWKLCKAFNSLGINAETVLLREGQFLPEKQEYNNSITRRHKPIRDKITKAKNNNNTISLFFWNFIEIFYIIPIFISSMKKYDVFIYVFSLGFFRGNLFLGKIERLEFYLLKKHGKTVISYCCGSDTRAPYLSSKNKNDSIKYLYYSTKRMAKRVHMLDHYSIVIDNSASAVLHQLPYINYHYIGNPVDYDELVNEVLEKRKASDTVRILHAPSNPIVKGTDIIRKVIDEIKSEGYNIQYVEKNGVSHDEILKEMQKSDLLINQMYSDTPLSMLDVEAGLNKVPVITCGYYAKYYYKDVKRDLIPNCFCLPEELKNKIKHYIDNPEQRVEMGYRECEYIQNNLMLDIVAKKVLKIIDDDFPQEWVYNPTDSSYIWGCGINKNEIVKRVYHLISIYGEKSLRVSDKPKLLNKFKKIYHKINKIGCE